MLRMAKTEGKIQELPFDSIVQLRHKSKKKELLSPEQVERSIESAQQLCPRSGKQFSDYVRLCCYSGGRETEVLNPQWTHVHFERALIEFRDETKYGNARFVNINPILEAPPDGHALQEG